jgi:uncharacterized protein
VPTNPLYELRINARELLRQPGATRAIDTSISASDLGVADERIAGAVDISLAAVSTIDGVTVRGTLAIPWQAPCRRCLTEVAGRTLVDVDEVYQDEVTDDAAFQIEGDQIDLAPAVREYVLLELPAGPLCRSDCQGICPICGIDRNLATCDCDTTVRDDRWAALDDLRFD